MMKSKGWTVRMSIRGPASPKERRQIALAISKVVSRTFTLHEQNSWIVHPAGYWANKDRDESRGILLSRAPRLGTREGRTGFAIRIQRLKLGLTQMALSTEAKVNSSHLSLIERGLCEARGQTLYRLESALRTLALRRISDMQAQARAEAKKHPKKSKNGEREWGDVSVPAMDRDYRFVPHPWGALLMDRTEDRCERFVTLEELEVMWSKAKEIVSAAAAAAESEDGPKLS